jgi:hypothetical protein
VVTFRPLLALALLIGLLLASAAPAEAACDRYASMTGSDGNSGASSDAPFQHVQKLVDSLQAGQTGCLMPGQPFDAGATFTHGGAAGAPITLTSSNPNARATVAGYLWVQNTAPHVVIRGIRHDQTTVTNSPGLRIEADDVTILGNELFNDTLPCLYAASNSRAAGLLVEGNRIHTCAVAGNGSSGIDLESADAPHIVDNYVYETPGFGIITYDDGDNALIEHNVIDSASQGVQFGGTAAHTATGDTVRDNVITRSSEFNVAANYENSQGSGNTVTGNCLDGPNGRVQPSSQFTYDPAQNTLIGGLVPYADLTTFQLASNGPCAGKGPLPAATTGSSVATSRQATVKGEVNPHFQPARWRVEYGATASLGSTTALKEAGEGSLPASVETVIDGLTPGTTYSYRVVAENLSGGSRTGATLAFTTPPLPDADSDGIPDETDACDNLERGTFDANVDGCPDDSDLDGILDAADACRSTPRGPFDTNTDGCPDDSDRDGIPDAADDCRTIPRGTFDTDKDGCPNPAPKVQAGPVRAKFAFFMRNKKRTAIFFKSVRMPADEPGLDARLVCIKHCKLSERHLAAKPGTLTFKKLSRRRLPLNAVMEIRVTKADRLGIAFRLTVDAKHGEVDIARRCIPPGTLKPTRDKC